MTIGNAGICLAQAAPAAGGSQGGGGLMMFGYMAIIFALFYFMMIRPQMKKEKQPMMEGRKALRLKKNSSFVGASCNGTTCLFPSLRVIKSEDMDNPKQTRKRRMKLKRLMRNIPKDGARALATLNDRMK